ncbi:DUF4198 domain-containing protein [Lysobacter sp. K5869]|uniref:DUF4198 domain-containing protein n=1 Tax=Lysobacter sp. K5869 TaxID=2820808 RepID=UPI001C0603E3|nr:DUF4198 domain-containing protein [Lysobacter sp. K5869]QWP75436.1 DUF4198 domain-containing protein [Lysobacter sp. K5869]
MMRPLSVLAALLCSAPAAAHDFWIQPERYRAQAQAATGLTLQVGHGRDRQRSAIPSRRIQRFEAIAADGRRLDLRPQLHPDPQAPADARFAVPAGAWMLVLETDAGAQSRLPAPRFNDYLRAEGLTPALEQRRSQGREAADGSERYSRRSKALVRAGSAPADAAALLATPLGLPLEILLDADPQSQAKPLSVRVLWQGRPLPGALVKLTRLENDAQPLDAQRTDAAGRAGFAAPGVGTWLLNAIWTRPLPADSEVDFETTFTSLSFEIAAGASR